MNATVSPATRPVSVGMYIHDLSGGGVERQTLALADKLATQGADVTLILHNMAGELRDHVPASISVVGLNGQRTLEDIPRLAQYLRTDQPDILMSNLDHNNVAALLAKACAASPTRVVICEHNAIAPDAVSFPSWTYRMVPVAYRALSPFISKAVAVSEGVAGELMGLAHLPQDKIAVIHNPVIGDEFAASCVEPVDHPWLNERDYTLFVTAGRLVPQKDHETLLRALALHRSRKPSRLLVLGSGELEQSLRVLAQHLGIADAVDFLGFKANPLPYFRLSDVFVLSSRSEGFGNVLVEAMACGTPVIATDCRHGPSEILQDGLCGTLVPPCDPMSMAVAMDGADALRARCPPFMLRTRAAEFTAAGCARKYANLFDTLVHGPVVLA